MDVKGKRGLGGEGVMQSKLRRKTDFICKRRRKTEVKSWRIFKVKKVTEKSCRLRRRVGFD